MEALIAERRDVVQEWIQTNRAEISDAVVLALVSTLVNGSGRDTPEPLLQFMDMAFDNYVRWIPFHMVYILEALKDAANINITPELRYNLRELIGLLASLENEPSEDSDGWEVLFVIVLFVRAMTAESNELLGTSQLNEETKVSFNAPLLTRQVSSSQDKNRLERFLDTVPEHVGNGPRLSVYYPCHGNFQGYDCFLVSWDQEGHRSWIHGYYLQDGPALPNHAPSPRISKSYAIRSCATPKEQEECGWVVPSTTKLEEFFGITGRDWTPEKWKALLMS